MINLEKLKAIKSRLISQFLFYTGFSFSYMYSYSFITDKGLIGNGNIYVYKVSDLLSNTALCTKAIEYLKEDYKDLEFKSVVLTNIIFMSNYQMSKLLDTRLPESNSL